MKRKETLQIVRAINDVESIKALLRVEIEVAPKIAFEARQAKATKDLKSRSKAKRAIARAVLKEVYTSPVTKKGTWAFYAQKLLSWLEGDMEGKPPFSIFISKGNSKLPFCAFSSLALADCPGKGKCARWCYSLKAWRYPAAFFRQVQNSLLLRFNRDVIEESFRGLKDLSVLRLYVDGDFMDAETIAFWLQLIKERPDIVVYGYSKSWREFLSLAASGFEFPSNYLLNISSGSRHEGTGLHNAIQQLPIARGDFVAVSVDPEFIRSKAYQDKANKGSTRYRKQVSEKLKALTNSKKVFACPGNCGNCLPNGRHACGSKDFDGVTIGIGIHA